MVRGERHQINLVCAIVRKRAYRVDEGEISRDVVLHVKTGIHGRAEDRGTADLRRAWRGGRGLGRIRWAWIVHPASVDKVRGHVVAQEK